MDSPLEPLPPIVDERLIEAPFEVAVLGQTYVVAGDDDSLAVSASASSREVQRAERSAIRQARREAKAQAKIDAKVAKRAPISTSSDSAESSDDVASEQKSPSSQADEPGVSTPRVRKLSFDDLIDGQ